eukprot:12209619-Alexandrium_andersonii.AAC.1
MRVEGLLRCGGNAEIEVLQATIAGHGLHIRSQRSGRVPQIRGDLDQGGHRRCPRAQAPHMEDCVQPRTSTR